MATDRRAVPLLDVLTPRRLVTAAVLVLVVVLSVYGLQSVRDTRAAVCGGGVILKLYPCPGDSDLRQGQIGVAMAPGYLVDLFVDNTPIPKDQLKVQGTIYSFTPGPGSETGALAPGAHTARIVYYQDLAHEATGQQYAWSFSTH